MTFNSFADYLYAEALLESLDPFARKVLTLARVVRAQCEMKLHEQKFLQFSHAKNKRQRKAQSLFVFALKQAGLTQVDIAVMLRRNAGLVKVMCDEGLSIYNASSLDAQNDILSISKAIEEARPVSKLRLVDVTKHIFEWIHEFSAQQRAKMITENLTSTYENKSEAAAHLNANQDSAAALAM